MLKLLLELLLVEYCRKLMKVNDRGERYKKVNWITNGGHK